MISTMVAGIGPRGYCETSKHSTGPGSQNLVNKTPLSPNAAIFYQSSPTSQSNNQIVSNSQNENQSKSSSQGITDPSENSKAGDLSNADSTKESDKISAEQKEKKLDSSLKYDYQLASSSQNIISRSAISSENICQSTFTSSYISQATSKLSSFVDHIENDSHFIAPSAAPGPHFINHGAPPFHFTYQSRGKPFLNASDAHFNNQSGPEAHFTNQMGAADFTNQAQVGDINFTAQSGIDIAHFPNQSTVDSGLPTSSLNSSNSSINSSPNCMNGTISTMILDQAGVQGEFSPPISQPQGPPPYCPSHEYLPSDPYYPAGPPPEPYCHHPVIQPGATGPATLRMVSSNSTPPMPLPVQMPPGQFAQLVDENGALSHVILSTPVLCSYGPGGSQGPPQFYSGPAGPHQGPGGNQGPHQFYSGPAGPHHVPPFQPAPPYPPVMTSPPLSQASPPPPLNYTKNDTRPPRHQDKTHTGNKIYPRQLLNNNVGPPTSGALSSQHYSHNFQSVKHSTLRTTPPMSPSKDGPIRIKKTLMNGEVDNAQPISIQELLSNLRDIQISEIGPYSAKVTWTPPDIPSPTHIGGDNSPNVRASDFPLGDLRDMRFDVYLNSYLYGTFYENYAILNKLTPGTVYGIYLICFLNTISGYPSQKQTFTTKATAPDEPRPPRLIDRKKHAIAIRWMAPKDNGAKITSYIVQAIGGHLDTWTQVYMGKDRDFYFSKLSPGTYYKFRVCAINEVGSSDFCSELCVTTVGMAPTQPFPPVLERPGVTTLTLSWQETHVGVTFDPGDLSFSLEMDDPHNEYGFRPVFNGLERRFTCTSLVRNTTYKFRMCCSNQNGKSPFSESVQFKTLPDRPLPPGAPTIKNRHSSDRMVITWAPPKDEGGSAVDKYNVQISLGSFGGGELCSGDLQSLNSGLAVANSGKNNARNEDYDSSFNDVYSGFSTECEVSGLNPGTSYKFRCRAESCGGKSNWGPESILATKPVVPGPVQQIRLGCLPKSESLVLKWSAPSYSGGAQVTEYYVDMISPDTSRRQVYIGNSTECTVASLLPGRSYIFLVKAINRVGEGPWSEPFEAVSGAGPPEAPKAPTVSVKGPHSVTVMWDTPFNNGSNIETYNLQYAELGENFDATVTSLETMPSSLKFKCAYAGSNHETEVRNLLPDRRYAFRVCARNAAGDGPFSCCACAKTFPSAPSQVTEIRCETHATEVQLGWSVPKDNGDPITHYKIEVNAGGFNIHSNTTSHSKEPRTIVTSSDLPEFLITELLPTTTYKFRVQAVNNVGCSPFSSTHKTVTKSLPPIPPELELVKASSNCLKIKWGSGANLLQHKYLLEMECLNPQMGQMEFYHLHSGSSESFKVTKLEENTNYTFRISATNEEGTGPLSNPVVFKTTKAPPAPLKAPKVTEIGCNSCRVEWPTIKCHSSDTMIYRLQLSSRGLDYNLAYKGSANSYALTELQSNTTYAVRVCGMRTSGDGEVAAGPYSPPTQFNTKKNEVSENDTVEPRIEALTSLQVQSFRWRDLSDGQRAFSIIVLFAIFAFIVTHFLFDSEHLR